MLLRQHADLVNYVLKKRKESKAFTYKHQVTRLSIFCGGNIYMKTTVYIRRYNNISSNSSLAGNPEANARGKNERVSQRDRSSP